MESDCCKYVQRCHQCQIHGDLIKVPPSELNVMRSLWPFVAWGMDVIGPIEPAASNGHRFILVAIDYFTKWVEATSHTSVTKKVVADFVQNHIICRFSVLDSIITNNGENVNSHLMKDICEQFKITHRNSTAYWLQMNRALPYDLLGYLITARTSTGATKYLLVYGTVEIPSLRIIQEAELDDTEIARAFNKQVKTRHFQIRQMVLKRIFPHQDEYKGKFALNWKGPYVVRKVLSGGSVVLAEMEGQKWPKPINSDAIKRYYA
ncbi:uncharacterized protein LOC132610933 [Lycium barbarum]|uniref:uncharacterized protein LOC132610933 n=1 Tax=Lycium barbarum TaxID=112863 RepID=UPI00293E03BC|nr:uncharacterized protein LOC132610933 [Lycium barbarum]